MADRTVSVRLTADIATFERRIRQAAGTVTTAGRQILTTAERQAAAFDTVGVAAAAMGAAGALALRQMAAESIGWESSFAGVRKTVKGTAAELDVLGASLRSMALRDVPVSVNALADIAASAGQLGIQTGRIEGFTAVIADLGVATNLTGEQAATSLARLANITQMPQESFDRLGATIVALGNNLATTESEIVDMGLRLAGAGAQVGLTEDQILALAGTLSSVGVEAEAGGTAFSRVMVDMAQAVETSSGKLDTFAEVAGMSAEEFATAWRTDPAEAIAAFVTGLGDISAAGGNTFGVLEQLELGEIRVRDALLRTSGAGNLLTRSLELSAQAWEDNTALTEEAAQRYATTESQVQFAKNALVDLGIELGDHLLPVVDAAADGIGTLAGFMADLPDPVQATAVAFLAVASAIGVLGGATLLALPRIAATKGALAELGITAASTRSTLLSLGTVKFAAVTAGAALITKNLLDARSAAAAFVEELRLDAGDNPADQLATLNTTLEELEEHRRSLGGFWARLWDNPLNPISESRARVDELSSSLEELRADLEAAAYEGQRFGGHQQALNHYLDLGYSYTDAFAAASMEMAQNADAAATATDGWTQRVIDNHAATRDGITATDGWANSVLDAEVAARRLGGGVEALGAAQREQLQGFAGYADNMGAYEQMLADLNAANRTHAEETAAATASAEDSWEDYFTEVPASAELYLQSLADQAAAQQEWATLVTEAQQRGLDDLAAQIVAAGPEQNALFRELLLDGPMEQAIEAERLLEQQALNNLAGMVAVIDRDGYQFVDAMGRVSGDAVEAMAEELGWSKEAVAAALDASEAVIAEREARIVDMFGDTGRNAVAALNAMLADGVVDAGELAWAYQEALRTGVNPLVIALGGESIPQQARILGVPVGVMRNEGGPIPGRGPDVDSVPAMLTPGEYVLRRAAVDRIGTGRLDMLNRGRGTVVPDIGAHFNSGGHVDPREGAAVAGPAHTGFSTARDVPTPPSHRYSGAVGGPLDAATALLYQAVVDYVEQFGAGRPELGTQPFAKGGGGGPAGRYTAGMMRAYEHAVSLGFSSIGGYRASGSVKGSDHPRHRAWDFMLPGGVGAEAPGWQLSNWHIANSTDVGLKYLIFSDMINSGSGWRGYRHPSDPSGRNPTLAHRDHVHASYLANGGIVPSQPGGARPVIGEGAHDELVLPLGGQALTDVGATIAAAILGLSGPIVLADSGPIVRPEAPGNFGRQPSPEVIANAELLRIEGLAPAERLAEVQAAMAAMTPYTNEWMELLREGQRLQADIARETQDAADEAERLARAAQAAADAAREAAEARARETQQVADGVGAELNRLLDRKAALDRQAAEAIAANAEAVARAQRAAADEIDRLLGARQDALAGAFGGVSSRFTVGWGNSVGALTDNTRDQIALFDEWADGMDTLRSRGISDTMVEALGLDDPASLGQVRMLLRATSTELHEFDAVLAAQQDRVAARAEQESSLLLGALGRSISDVREQLATNLDDLHEDLTENLARIAEEAALLGMDTGRSYAELMAEALASGLPGVIAMAEKYEEALQAARDAARELARLDAASRPGIHISEQPGQGPPVIGPGGNWGEVLAGGVHTYDTGGRWPAGTLGFNAGASGDEWVLTDPQLRAMVQAAPSSRMPSAVTVRIGEREFTGYIEDISDGYHHNNTVRREMAGTR